MISLLILCLALFPLLSILWSTIRYGISPMPSNRAAQKTMLALIPEASFSTIIELGSGWGNLAYAVAKKHPQAKVIGYETSLVPYLFATLCYRHHNLSFQWRNFLKQEIPDGALLMCYLYPGGMHKLSQFLASTRC